MRVLEGFGRLPLLVRLLVWGAVVWVARTYVGWLPDDPLGIALGVGSVLALSVMLTGFVQARRDRKRRALLARFGGRSAPARRRARATRPPAEVWTRRG
jgi:hypothetical protein